MELISRLAGPVLGLVAVVVLVGTVSYGYSREPGSRDRQVAAGEISDTLKIAQRRHGPNAALDLSEGVLVANLGRSRFGPPVAGQVDEASN